VVAIVAANLEKPFDFENTFLYLKRMKTEISFCPTCAGKLDVAEDDQFECEDCETKFYIQIAEEGDGDDEEEEEEY
jgi:tRNA(Ile2) C34 agmatinyltransferase TiaS